ncbi:MAG: outer membrane lipoprotein carrier protein LolA [Planctomycetes bacterium]|nr:outer membrane lipoprotein carrier protein LolA [Planctomycetota bacterium]
MKRLSFLMIMALLAFGLAFGEEKKEGNAEKDSKKSEEKQKEANAKEEGKPEERKKEEKKPDKRTKKEIMEDLEKHLSEIETVQARFVQEKHLAMFERKMIIEGHLAVANPNKVAWHVQKPVRYRMVICGPKLKQWEEDTNEVKTLRLDKNATYKVAFEQLTAWFAGRYGDLRERYNVELMDRDPLTLTFTPKEGGDMESIIKSVRVVFRDNEDYLKKIKITQGNDDVTIVRFFDLQLNEKIDEEVWRVRPDE